MKDLYYRLKWALQRAWRGYDETAERQLDSYFETVVPAIKKLCTKWLAETYADYNLERKAIFEETLRLIDIHENGDDGFFGTTNRNNLFIYVSKNLGWYWI